MPRRLSYLSVLLIALSIGTFTPSVAGQEPAPPEVPFPKGDIGLATLQSRQKVQLETAKQFKVFYQFHFKDELQQSGITFRHRILPYVAEQYMQNHYDHGTGLAVADVDGDGLYDIYFVNQVGGNELWKNLGNGKFKNITEEAGVGLKDRISVSAAFADIDNSGREDLFVTTVNQGNVLFQNDGHGHFKDITQEAGVGLAAHSSGVVFFDYDNDGLLDLFVANGHVYPGVDKQDWGTTWAQRPLLLRNLDGMKFQEVPPATGSGLAAVITGRGAAFGDLFNDGRIDVVINSVDSKPTLLRNVVKNSNHWVTLKLVGGPKSPRDAIGAKAFVTAGGFRQRGDVFSGGSYASSSDQRLHFGLGTSTQVDNVEIHWPSGVREQITLPEVDRIYTVVEGKGIAQR